MKLYGSHVTPIAQEIVRLLTSTTDHGIEAESPREVILDIEAVLKNYLAVEKDVNDKAKELLDRTGRSMDQYQKVREQIAESKGIRVGDEMLDHLLDEIVSSFHRSPHVDEIYDEDVELRRKMAPIFKKHFGAEDSLESEIRAQLKHVQEGTPLWEIEHARVAEQIRRKRGLA
ncbi:MAG: DUF507 family protein [Myxococcales bacterium]|nr:DUF507 family protein [Myxococcales bacterium]